jgi:hypothetical protein
MSRRSVDDYVLESVKGVMSAFDTGIDDSEIDSTGFSLPEARHADG